MFKRILSDSVAYSTYIGCSLAAVVSDLKYHIVNVINIFKKNTEINDYLNFNQKFFNSFKLNKAKGAILLDCFPVPDWIIVNSLFLNELAYKNELEIVSYGLRQRDQITDLVYKSFNCQRHLRVKLTKEMRKKRRYLFLDIKSRVNCKDDLFNLHVEDIWIGMDIYESILRNGVPTVDLEKRLTWRIIFYALTYLVFFQEAFSNEKIKVVALSHDNYIGMGLIARIAYNKKVPVYLANSFGILKTTNSHQIYEVFKDYKNIFEGLDESEKINAISWSKYILNRRIGGEVGVEMSYQKKSAHHNKLIERQTSVGSKFKVIVATHCFYDSPHGYGGMIFPDFYEWLRFLGTLSVETDYDWYLKPHADYLPGTLEVLRSIVQEFPKFKIIDPNVSWGQLKAEGADTVLTCYGSLGHELPLLGWKVINASYNPHISYEFNWHAKDIGHYGELIRSLELLGPIQDIEKIYEFFYVHKKLMHEETFFFEDPEHFSSRSFNDILGNKHFEKLDMILNSASNKISAYVESDKKSTNPIRNSLK